MNVIDRIEDEAWEALLTAAAQHFSDLTLKRGFQYYKQDRVLSLELSEPDVLEAEVEGTIGYLVTVPLAKLELAACTCPVTSTCKHAAAVLFAYAHAAGRSLSELANAKWRQHMVPSSNERTGTAGRPAAHAPTKDAFAETERLAEMSVAEWQAWFEARLAPMADRHRNDLFVREAERLLLGRLPDMPETDALLYALNARLRMLHELYKGGDGGAFIGYFTHLAASVVDDAIGRLLAGHRRRPAPPERWDRVKDTLALLRDEMARGGENGIRLNRYYLNTLDVVVRPCADAGTCYREEWEAWQSLDAGLLHRNAKHTRALAMSWLAFAMGRDADAFACLHEADENGTIEAAFLLALLEDVEDDGPPERLSAWLEASAPYLRSRRPQELQAYAAYWEALLERMPDAETRMWDTLAGMLPYTESVYGEMLFARGRYRQWIDYQLSVGTDPLSLRARDLQPIEKEAPELLLPFYHQGAERLIALRNRDGYKRAVKLMKRLAKLYKKLKQEQRWTDYLEVFTARHSRLRALQEEMRKGSLL